MTALRVAPGTPDIFNRPLVFDGPTIQAARRTDNTPVKGPTPERSSLFSSDEQADPDRRYPLHEVAERLATTHKKALAAATMADVECEDDAPEFTAAEVMKMAKCLAAMEETGDDADAQADSDHDGIFSEEEQADPGRLYSLAATALKLSVPRDKVLALAKEMHLEMVDAKDPVFSADEIMQMQKHLGTAKPAMSKMEEAKCRAAAKLEDIRAGLQVLSPDNRQFQTACILEGLYTPEFIAASVGQPAYLVREAAGVLGIGLQPGEAFDDSEMQQIVQYFNR